MVIESAKNGEKIVGTMIRLVRNPAIARIASENGLDFIMMDMEHGPYSMETIADIFKVARSIGLGSFVRVPELSKGYVSRAIDSGANGVMVPMVESVQQARQLADWTKYPPLGKRGLGGSGGHTDFLSIGGKAMQFMDEANKNNLTIAQIETRSAIEAIDEIASVEGIDALLIGPNDLANSLGCPGDISSDVVGEAIAKVAEAARKHKKIFGMHSGDALLEKWIPEGLTLIMNKLDIDILIAGMRSIAQKYGG